MYSRLRDGNSENPTMKPAPPPPYTNFGNLYPNSGDLPAPAPAPAPAAPTVVSITNVGTETSQPMGPKPVILTCPQCRCRNKTQIKYRATARTHIACLLLSFTLCCCFLPYCMKSCRNVDHFCPTCEAFLGSYSS